MIAKASRDLKGRDESALEQAALRRIATLVADRVQPHVFFDVVAEEVSRVVDAPSVGVTRYEPDGTVTVCSAFPPQDPLFRSGARVSLDGDSVLSLLREHAASVRIDNYDELEGEIAAAIRRRGLRSSVGVPIVVDGRVWGAIVASNTERLPENTGARLSEFTELLAGAIANTEAREALARLANEQAALRRVATLVAKEDLPETVFAKVAEETGRLLGGVECTLLRNERDGTASNVGSWGEEIFEVFPLGTSFVPEGDGVAATVLRTGRPYRIDDYATVADPIARSARDRGIESSVGCPIVVRGSIWGAIVVGTTGAEPFPPETETRLTQFADLVGTAVANAEARGEIVRLADEQAALRRVATLVAGGASPEALCRAVTDEVAAVVGLQTVTLSHHLADGSFTVVAAKNNPGFPVGSRWPLEGPSLAATIHETGRAARIDDYSTLGGAVAAAMHDSSMRAAAGSPIVVNGEVWGHISVAAKADEPLPAGTEQRLRDFTELISNAISNAESGDALARLADEQAALRRVATLVAQGMAPNAIFSAVCEEVGHLIEADITALEIFTSDTTTVVAALWSTEGPTVPVGTRRTLGPNSIGTQILATRAPARRDRYDEDGEVGELSRTLGLASTVGAPILAGGRLWGALNAGTRRQEPWAKEAESRLAGFTELIATSIANAESRDALAHLADEQAALRRVATLVARDADPGEVFNAVAKEVGKLLDTDITVVGRYDGDGAATATGSWSASPGGVPVGTRSVVGGHNVLTLVAETEKPARVDGYDDASGEAADIARDHGWRSSIAAPISVEGRLWGVMLVATQRPEPFPVGAEERLAAFTDLVATALANAQAHDEVRRFGEEQAALGRVATLVAAGAAPERVFSAVVEEAASLLGLERIELVRYEGDIGGTVIAASGDHPFPAGSTWSLDDPSVMATVARTRRAARIDDYTNLTGEIAQVARGAGFQSAIGAPITIEGRLWGVVIAISTEPQPIPERSEARLGQFTELVATAVANAEARESLAQLADEQAALRRVATLVAEGVEPDAIFSAVGEEIGRLFGSTITTVGRFEPDAEALVALGVGTGNKGVPIGSRWEIDDLLASGQVFRTGRSVRVDEVDWSAVRGELGPIGDRLAVASTVASPIFVEGHLWGVVSVSDNKALPEDAEERLEKFSELIATAIANAENSAELAASRRRIVTAADDARRRIERDLHDGIQQRLIALSFRARAMTRKPPDELPDIAAELSEGLKDVSDELREVSRGIHPTILTEAGLGPALRALARRSDVPVDVDVNLDDRLPTQVEAAAYYIASEALTNVAKHADAKVVQLAAAHDEQILMLEIRDDGIGGVDTTRGSGILGLTDRVEALGGTISIASPPRGGTTLSVRLPLNG